jgi:F0F1-type ATP synthase epsilon subunit
LTFIMNSLINIAAAAAIRESRMDDRARVERDDERAERDERS